MTLYSLFTRNGAEGPSEAPEAVGERFSWFAFLLPPVYALVHGLWLAFLGLVLAILVLGFAGRWLGDDATFWLYWLAALWFGLEAPAFRARKLHRKGYHHAGDSIAAAEDIARLDYLKNR
ncbi:hypothetical protein GCM10011321_35350 [Youhaiella tibetensis]|uniref:DUF2628 domain-containing protein n=1 Tax=Paradevosia tibetensis TaxID=1447062 RepID=A0A5B9DUX5_9HYPH|nr:DUF2628 domain-containing protein [Youhaiella tibetensis]QEE22509.1 DUF2628 domain-containing protein [Youhaiella tibetensis]GGF41679.1 hypothetical protein GCM10011321_35350 [Youhaiella tibetensis]